MSNDAQMQPEDSLVDRGVDDVLDEGFSPPEKPRGVYAKGVTAEEQLEGESLEERLAQEEPDDTGITPSDAVEDDDLDSEESDDPAEAFAGDERSGRLVAPDEGSGLDEDQQQLASDVGVNGAGASAEEAAMHTWSEDQLDAVDPEDEDLRPDTV